MSVKLADLEPWFTVAVNDGAAMRFVDALADAQGVMFLCPKCYVANKGPVGTHCVLVWFSNRNVPAACQPSPRWAVSGTGFGDLTTTPSIHLRTGCCWHGFITNGDVR